MQSTVDWQKLNLPNLSTYLAYLVISKMILHIMQPLVCV